MFNCLQLTFGRAQRYPKLWYNAGDCSQNFSVSLQKHGIFRKCFCFMQCDTNDRLFFNILLGSLSQAHEVFVEKITVQNRVFDTHWKNVVLFNNPFAQRH